MLQKSVAAWRWWAARRNAFIPLALMRSAPLDLRIVGRMLLHAALVGAAAGLAGAAFFAGAEYTQRYVLEMLAGYRPLRAVGETFVQHLGEANTPFHPWILVFLPALGALVSGMLCRLAPETRGGGGDAMIHAFHHEKANVRLRVLWVRALSAMATLGSGGCGGREGPTMQMGGAIGSAVARLLRMGTRERRILYIAGVAAGMAAVFRTPLGAALLAVEVLYRDDFEAEALVPSILASVVAYSVVISIFGKSTLFGVLPHFEVALAHLPLYGMMAIGVAGAAAVFVKLLHGTHHAFDRLPVPAWLRPALGGLILGALCVPLIIFAGAQLGQPGAGMGLLGGSYGAAQLALTGSTWLGDDWGSVRLLLTLGVVKLVASCLTIGSGGSAGDFAPSLILGGLFGGAFGHAAALLLHDPHIQPGAFALVGMATFYGGVAHVPLSSLVMVCELAGSYDLLVPLMLAEGIAFVALRRQSLYRAQIPSQRESPVHRDAALMDVLSTLFVRDVMTQGRPYVTFVPQTPAAEMLRLVTFETGQAVFPVIDADGRVQGIVTDEVLHLLALERGWVPHALAVDLMQDAVLVREDDTLLSASAALLDKHARAAVVVDAQRAIVGFLDEADIAKPYLKAAVRAEAL